MQAGALFLLGERGWGRCFSLDMRVGVLKDPARWHGLVVRSPAFLENPSNKVKTQTHGLFWMILMKHNVIFLLANGTSFPTTNVSAEKTRSCCHINN